MNEGQKLTILSAEALIAHRRVKMSGAAVIYADAGDIGIGVNEFGVADATKATIRLDSGGGSIEMCASAAIVAGKRVYPAADGKVSQVPTGASIGVALEAASGDASVIPVLPILDDQAFQGRTFETLADNKTLDVEDVGKVFIVTVDAKAITLPATDVGLGPVTIINGGADAAVAVNVSPNANDLIKGPDIAGTDNKDQINTKTTAITGDYITITGDGVEGWVIEAMRGTWAEEA